MTKTKAQKQKARKVHAGPSPAKKPKKKKTLGGAPGGFKKIAGHGDYNVMQNGNLGEHIGQAAGGLISGGLNKLWNWISGNGDYTVKHNSLISGRPPMFATRTGMDGTMEFAHSEFLQDVQGSTLFQLQSFNINPGLFASFPYLSNLARNFEQYELKGLVFQFKSTSASALNSTNTALGTVIMSTEYDALDMNFINKQQMEAYMFTTACNPSESMVHPVECAKSANVLSDLYVRSTIFPTGADQRFYDLGNFQIATVGMQAAATIGELWVSYHVMLKKPKLPTEIGSASEAIHAHEYPLDTATPSNPFGTAISTPNRFYSGCTEGLVDLNANTMTLRKLGRFLVTIRWLSGGVCTDSPGVSSSGSFISGVAWFDGNSTDNTSNIDVSGATMQLVVDVTSNYDYLNPTYSQIAFTGPTGMTIGRATVTVVQLPSHLSLEQRRSDTKKGEFFDDLIDRLSRLEASQSSSLLRSNSLTDEDDWKCSGVKQRPRIGGVKIGKVPLALPNMDKTIKEAQVQAEPVSSSSLSESVVNLITAKLRK